MGLDELLGYTPKKAAKLIKNFLKTGLSVELDLILDTSRWELPSSELICAAGYYIHPAKGRDFQSVHDDSISLGVQTKLRQATTQLTNNYEFDGDKKYLTQLIVLSAAFDRKNAPKFYEKLKESDFYNKLGRHLKSMINEKYKSLTKNN